MRLGVVEWAALDPSAELLAGPALRNPIQNFLVACVTEYHHVVHAFFGLIPLPGNIIE
jgi:hypothetical protein